jgi:hypothetical protein
MERIKTTRFPNIPYIKITLLIFIYLKCFGAEKFETYLKHIYFITIIHFLWQEMEPVIYTNFFL